MPAVESSAQFIVRAHLVRPWVASIEFRSADSEYSPLTNTLGLMKEDKNGQAGK